MKQYEKPRLVALSLSANDMLCSGCNTKMRDDPFSSAIFPDVTGDGKLDSADFADGRLFASEADSCGAEYITMVPESYCKFTGADEDKILWS